MLGLGGVLTYGWLLVDGWSERLTWVTRPQATGSPVYALLRPVLPDLRRADPVDVGLHAAWVAVVVAVALRVARPPRCVTAVVALVGVLVAGAALRRDDGTLVREPVVAGEPRTDAPLPSRPSRPDDD